MINHLLLNSYSTTEQRIGTYTDGKPIYRKVVSGNFSAHPAGTNWNEPHTNVVSNLETIVNMTAIKNNQYSILYNKNMSNDYFMITYREGNGFTFAGNQATTPSDEYVVTLEYTKTTD